MNNNPAILSAVLDLDIEGIVLKQGRRPTCQSAGRAAEREEIPRKASLACWKNQRQRLWR